MIYKGNTPVSIERTVEKKKYGATAGSLLGDVDANGVLQQPSEATDLVFTGVKGIVTYGMQYKFYNNAGIKSVSFPDLISISEISAMNYTFYGCTSLESASFAKLTTVSGQNGLNYCFRGCSLLANISFPELTSVTGNSGMYYVFYACPITTFSFPKLAEVSGSGCFRYAFNNCRNLTSLSFPALETTSFGSAVNQFQNIFNTNTAADSGAFTVHFPSNLQSTISGLTGYPTFGASSNKITLLYDLPASS